MLKGFSCSINLLATLIARFLTDFAALSTGFLKKNSYQLASIVSYEFTLFLVTLHILPSLCKNFSSFPVFVDIAGLTLADDNDN